MRVANSDFWVLAGILSSIGTVGIYEGMELHPLFYSQPMVIFSGLGYFAMQLLRDKRA